MAGPLGRRPRWRWELLFLLCAACRGGAREDSGSDPKAAGQRLRSPPQAVGRKFRPLLQARQRLLAHLGGVSRSGATPAAAAAAAAKIQAGRMCHGPGWAGTLRRCGWASTLRLWLLTEWLAPPCESCVAAAAKSVRRYASRYSGSRPLGGAKSRILLHHIWKCGGTELCEMAIRNGEAAPGALGWSPSDRCGAAALRPVDLVKANYSFVSWQYPLPPGPPVGDAGSPFTSVVVLRNPLDQALSHFRHAQADYGLWNTFHDFLDYGLCVASRAQEGDLSQCRQWLTVSARSRPQQEFESLQSFALWQDNQQTRWLAPGLQTWTGARPILAAADLGAAKARLAEFDEVLVLEELEARDRFRFAKYGWRNTETDGVVDVHRVGPWWTPHVRSNATAMLAKQPQVLARLQQLQKWDLLLYEYGCELARRQAAASAEAARPRGRGPLLSSRSSYREASKQGRPA